MILSEDSGVAYEMVCSELGYDTLGMPASDDEALLFEDYRRSGDLGSLIVASMPRVLCYLREILLAQFMRYYLPQVLLAAATGWRAA